MMSTLRGIGIERSPADTRDYRAVMLDNGLEALVVSDPEADKAAAALNVNVGSANDPHGRPGLAHFLEHMLFLGTAKYPDPGEYGRFLAEHGGCDNAATSFARTSYGFDVDAAHLEGALDRFARFFISPRFDREYVERERQVVHSEYVARRRNDRLRSFAAWRRTLDPRHPLSRFLAGNAQTLADRPGAAIRDELVDFYERTYSSHLMKLVVVGREPLDVLEGWVRTRFPAVPRRDFEPPRITVPLYPEGLLPARLDIEPIRDLRTISCSFAVPPVRSDYPCGARRSGRSRTGACNLRGHTAGFRRALSDPQRCRSGSPPAMNVFRQFPDLDPFVDVQKDSSLPPEPSCARLSDVLALVEPRLGATLLDAAGRGALRSVADRIPALISAFWGLEIRLGDPAPRADLLWEVSQGGGGIPTLAGRNDAQDAAPDVTRALRKRSLFWRELGRFAEEWLDSPDWLGRLGNIWLEADTASAEGAKLDACLDRPNLFWGPNGRVPGSDRDLPGYLERLGRRFYGLELDQARVDAVVDTIPREGRAFQVGVMGARAMPVVRLCVKFPDAGTRERWLADIGWPGDRASLHDTLAWLEPLSRHIALNVDILPDRVGEKLGLEVYSSERMFSTDTWQPLLDDLLARGLARPDKLAALKKFPSIQRFRQFGAWLRTPPIGFPVLGTNLHHLKLVFVGDAVLEAKAYLAVFRPMVDYSPSRGGDNMEGSGGWL